MQMTTSWLLKAALFMVATILMLPTLSTAAAQQHDEKPLELSGFSLSQAYEIDDRNPLDLAESKLNKLLYRIKKTANQNLRNASRFSNGVSWQKLTEDPSDHRLWVFHRPGRVQTLHPQSLPGTGGDDPVRGAYLARCLSESGDRFNVLTLSAPSAWKPGVELDQPIEFIGFFYSLIQDSEDEPPTAPVPLFVAKRLAWIPEEADSSLVVTPSHAFLAARGVDIGLFDFVREQSSKPLGNEDSETFFQMLAAIEDIQTVDSLEPLGFSELMQSPLKQIGNFVSFRARVRKCSPVQITDQEMQTRLGFDQYYQLMVFPDLDDQQIVVRNPDGEDLVYRRFPVTMCARSLPMGMDPADIENQQILVEGFYFRIWKYASEMTNEAGVSGQISPLIISRQPIMVVNDENTLNIILCGFMLVTILGLVALFWIFRNSRQRSPLKSSLGGLPDQIDVTGME